MKAEAQYLAALERRNGDIASFHDAIRILADPFDEDPDLTIAGGLYQDWFGADSLHSVLWVVLEFYASSRIASTTFKRQRMSGVPLKSRRWTGLEKFLEPMFGGGGAWETKTRRWITMTDILDRYERTNLWLLCPPWASAETLAANPWEADVGVISGDPMIIGVGGQEQPADEVDIAAKEQRSIGPLVSWLKGYRDGEVHSYAAYRSHNSVGGETRHFAAFGSSATLVAITQMSEFGVRFRNVFEQAIEKQVQAGRKEGARSLIDVLGLKESPFNTYTAEGEVMEQHRVNLSGLRDLTAAATKLQPFVVFGDRGAGKTSLRFALTADVQSVNSDLLIVQFDDVGVIARGTPVPELSLSNYLSALGYEVCVAVLTRLADDDRTLDHFDSIHRKLAEVLVERFYLSRDWAARALDDERISKVVSASKWIKTVRWMRARKKDGLGLLGRIVNKAVSIRFGEETAIDDELVRILDREDQGWIASDNAVRILEKLVAVARGAGYAKGISVFVDRLDEQSSTTASPAMAARVIQPILTEQNVLTVDGLGWGFFLWSKCRSSLVLKGARFDRCLQYSIHWTPEHLVELIECRLRAFRLEEASELSLADLFTDPEYAMEAMAEFIEMTSYSPRELLHLFSRLLRTHDEMPDSGKRIKTKTVQRAMNYYAWDVVYNMGVDGDQALFNELRQVAESDGIDLGGGAVDIGAETVARVLRIDSSLAEKKLERMVDVGFISRSLAGNTYRVGNPCVRRVIVQGVGR